MADASAINAFAAIVHDAQPDTAVGINLFSSVVHNAQPDTAVGLNLFGSVIHDGPVINSSSVPSVTGTAGTELTLDATAVGALSSSYQWTWTSVPSGSVLTSGSIGLPDSGALGPTAAFNMTGNVGLWHFEGNASDSSGLGHHGTFSSPPPTLTTGRVGEYAYAFTSSNQEFITIPGNVGAMVPDYPFAVSFWAQCSDTPAGDFQDAMVGNASNDDWEDGWGTYWTNSATVRFWINQYDGGTSDSAFVEVGSLNPLAWNHFVGVYDGSDISLYVNGVLGDTTALANKSLTGLTNNLFFGHMPVSYNFNGTMDEIALWNYALTSLQIDEIYFLQSGSCASGSIGLGQTFSFTPDVTGTYNLELTVTDGQSEISGTASALALGAPGDVASASIAYNALEVAMVDPGYEEIAYNALEVSMIDPGYEEIA